MMLKACLKKWLNGMAWLNSLYIQTVKLYIFILVEDQLVREGLPAEQNKEQIHERYIDSLWHGNIVYFLLYLQFPPNLTNSECISLKLRDMKYFLIEKVLY